MNIERRAVHAEVRAPEDQPGMFEAVVMRYGIVDDYDTVFDAGVFTDSLEQRMPRLTWSHDWSDLIGQVVDFKDTDGELRIVGQLDDFEAVPRARQAYAQLKSGTLDNFSVGFRRQETRDVDGRTHFTRAKLDEIALVLSGAVPDTELVSVRTIQVDGRRVPESFVIDLAKQVAAGELTHEAAQEAVMLATSGGVDLSGMAPHPEAVVEDGPEVALGEDALATLGME